MDVQRHRRERLQDRREGNPGAASSIIDPIVVFHAHALLSDTERVSPAGE
jgi:hypothetical protein